MINEEELDNDDEEEQMAAASTVRTFYAAKDGIKLMKTETVTGRPRSHNIPVVARHGPSRIFIQSAASMFQQYITPQMIDIICGSRPTKTSYTRLSSCYYLAVFPMNILSVFTHRSFDF